MHKCWALLGNILFSSLQYCFVPPFGSARTLTKACGNSWVSTGQKLPISATRFPAVASKSYVRERASDGRGGGYSLPPVWSTITSPSPVAPDSLVEFTVALVDILLRLNLIIFNIQNILWQWLYAPNWTQWGSILFTFLLRGTRRSAWIFPNFKNKWTNSRTVGHLSPKQLFQAEKRFASKAFTKGCSYPYFSNISVSVHPTIIWWIFLSLNSLLYLRWNRRFCVLCLFVWGSSHTVAQ